MRTTRWLAGIGAVVFTSILLLVWGCLSELRVHNIGASHRAALHAVHGERVQRKMGVLDSNYRKAQRLPIRLMKQRGFTRLEHCAEQIAVAATALPDLVDLGGASPEEKTMFERLADQLKTNAEALRAAAARRNRAEVREMFARLTSTCNACHAAFREPVGIAHDGES